MVDHHVYPDRQKAGHFKLYSDLLTHFIQDVRKDLNSPRLPFVIGVMGVGGANRQGSVNVSTTKSWRAFRREEQNPGGIR